LVEKMIDAADPTGEVKGQMRPHQGPAQPRPGADRRINIGARWTNSATSSSRLRRTRRAATSVRPLAS
jgi:hypothetical protein